MEYLKIVPMDEKLLLARITLNPDEMSQEEILEDYPDLEKEDLRACILFASKMIRIKSIEFYLTQNIKYCKL